MGYQAKWSREREEHTFKGLNVCIDKNAGYGYVAELERVIDDAKKMAEAIKSELGIDEQIKGLRDELLASHKSAVMKVFVSQDVEKEVDSLTAEEKTKDS